jgi:hypothetical protein
VFFLKRVVERSTPQEKRRLFVVYRALFLTLLLLPFLSRHKTSAFDRIGKLELTRAYGRELAGLFLEQPSIPLAPPWTLLALLGVRRRDARSTAKTSAAAAEAAAVRPGRAESAHAG